MDAPHLIVEAGKSERRYWTDVLRYRELFFFLAWRDILVRYKQTVIGIAWSVVRPLLTMVVFVFIFQRIANLPDNGVPYPILVFAAMLPWQFFSNAMTESSNSLIVNANMVSKVYFPRIIMPASSVVVACVDFCISLVLLCGIMAIYQFAPSINALALPLFALLAFITALGPGLLLSSLNVKYRDFRYIVPFIVQFGLYISPVGFSSGVVPSEYRMLYSLNPMVGVIDGFRWCIGGGDSFPLYLPGLCLSIAISFILLALGVWNFRRTERGFADVI
jgi:lipopolysaccharide transport system permease protein